MAFCKNCGTQLEDGAKFCPNCGTPTADEAPKAEQTNNAQTAPNTEAQPNGWEKFCSTDNDITAEVDPADAKDNVAFGILAYLFWLCLIPLFARKESKFCQFHAKQGMFLAVIESVAVILSILGAIPVAGVIFGILSYLIDLACTFFAVVGIYNVVRGKTRELPIIGKYNFFK